MALFVEPKDGYRKRCQIRQTLSPLIKRIFGSMASADAHPERPKTEWNVPLLLLQFDNDRARCALEEFFSMRAIACIELCLAGFDFVDGDAAVDGAGSHFSA